MNTEYYKSWEAYMAVHPEIDDKIEKVMAPKVQQYEEMMFNFIITLFL
ncbi:hypothetical protein HNQ80_003465 [Anaerosolibacter carboniphilus]|uniref:Uncharacterized protein n=1 Tax=Anaerosolibacter carboniphilus TaxID=1417629 RepID=A0A841KUM5_9FIRM|nr:hypothetical protein [Anaerosolibacter carboniphilus]MBB6217346.1 hypothetical protein [Anaerosolibacter carboniphilus]